MRTNSFDTKKLYTYLFIGLVAFLATRILTREVKRHSFAFFGMHHGYIVGVKNPNALAIYDTRYSLIKKYPLPFSPHSSIQNPNNVDEVLAIPELGQVAALINLVSDKITKIQLSDQSLFSGHGIFIPNQDEFALTVINKNNKPGELQFFNKEGTLIKTQSTFGNIPHMLEVDLHNSNFAIVANAGEKGSLVWINIADGKVIQRKNTEIKSAALKHFIQTKDDKILAYGLDDESALLYRYDLRKNTFENISKLWNAKFHGEILNLYMDEEFERFWATIPKSGNVLVLNPLSLNVEKSFERDTPTLILPLKNSEHLFITTDKKDKRRFFSRSKTSELKIESKDLLLDNLGPHISPFKIN